MHPDIDPKKQEKAKKYFLTRFCISKADSLISLLALVLLIILEISQGLSAAIRNLTSSIFLYRCIYFSAFFSLFYAVSLPFSFLSSFHTEHKYNFSNQTLNAWLIDHVKSYLVSLILGLIIINILYLIVNGFPTMWWLWLGTALVLFSVILQHLSPILLIPIFYKLEPLADETLKEKLLNLADKAKIKVIGVYNIKLSQKTKKANAALTGIGSTRRMLLGDTLIENYDHGEIETVMAHELGHHIHRHIFKLILLQGLLTMTSAYVMFLLLPRIAEFLKLGPVNDIVSFPAVVLLAGFLSFLAGPLTSYISRKLEIQADDTAVNLSGLPDKFISTMVKFANNYLSYAYPPKIIEWLEYDHPPIGKRIKRAEIFKTL